MVMTPPELDRRDFRKTVRGYSEEEVDYYLAQVRADYEAVYTENQDLKVRLDDYEQNVGKYKALEHTLNNTLIIAQQTAEDLKHNAEKAAELILEEAKLKAQQRIHQAEAEVRKLELQKEELMKRIHELRIRLRAFLRAQLDLLEESSDDGDTLPPTPKFKEETAVVQENHVVAEAPEAVTNTQLDVAADAENEISATSDEVEGVEEPQETEQIQANNEE